MPRSIRPVSSTVVERLLRYGASVSLAPTPRRSDAARNRARLIAAGAALLASHGSGVDVREIARRAGVGMGTLYRHFPAKRDLVDAAEEHALQEWVTVARAALTDDPWQDLCAFFADTLDRQARNRGLTEGCARPTWDTGRCRDTVRPLLADLALLLIALGRLTPLGRSAWHRTLQIALDGLRAHPGSDPLPGPPVTVDALDGALAREQEGR